MRLRNEIVFIVLSVLFACNQPAKKVVATNKKSPDSGSIIIDEPVGYKSPINDSSKGHNLKNQITKGISTRLIFKNYIVKLHDFNVFNKTYGVGGLNYNGDTSQVKLEINENDVINIIAIKDSVSLYDDPDGDFKIFEIIPKDKSDVFRYFCSYQVTLNKFRGDVNNSSDSDIKNTWVGMTNYKELKDSLHYFFNVGKFEIDKAMSKEIKGRLNLKDSIVIDNHEKINVLIYKHKPCLMNFNFICFRIERYRNHKLQDTKFINIVNQDHE